MQGPQFTYRMTAGSIVQPFFPGQPAYLTRDAALAYVGDFAGRPIQVQAGPIVRIRFDLTSYLPSAAKPPLQITNVNAVLDEDNGVDAAPGSRLYGAAAIESGSKIVHQDLFGLAPNGLYIITFTVVLNATQQQRFKVPFYTTGSVVQMAVREIDTVLPITGGPITDIGPIGLQTPLAITYGGTGGATGNAALDGLSNVSGSVFGSLVRSAAGIWSVTAAGAGTITGVTAGTGLTGGGTSGTVPLALSTPVSIANGGTNATTAAAALTSLGAAPLNSPGLTGFPTAPTLGVGTNSTSIATTAFVANGYLPLSGGALTGATTAPTPATADNSTAIATTAFVKAQGYAPLASPAFTGTPTAPVLTITGNYLYLANGTGLVNGSGGPFLYADAGTMVAHLGTSNNQFIVQDTSGNAALNLIVGTGIGTGQLLVRGGYNTKPGAAGAAESHVFNLSFPSSSTNLWIDSTNEGTIQVVVCDERIKKDIKPATSDSLAILGNVELFEYDRQTHPERPVRHEPVGFSAQQLAEAIPEAIHRSDDPDDLLGVQLLPIVAHLVNAVQQLKARLETSEAKLAALQAA